MFLVRLGLLGCSGSAPHPPAPPVVTVPLADAALGPPMPPVPLSLDSLHAGDHTHGFRADAVYLDDAGHPIGARLVHDHTGFKLDYLRIESAPQAHLWVDTFPTSDKGEPHTQEHLLLLKGDRGRRLGSMEAMALAESTAFTEQWRTSYLFNTVASHDTFWPVFENELDAMLYPDYSDEEIRREVRNFGVDKHADGTLHLEEKGTVYNEMVRDYETPDTFAWRAAGQLVYGAKHPLSYESGGFPDAIRAMTPADIRAFHDAAYHLTNMGMIGAFPSSMALADVLDRTAAIVDAEHAREQAGATPAVTETTVPPAQPAPAGTVVVADAPSGEATTPVPVIVAWPATRRLGLADRVLLELLLDAIAGDPGTPLYDQLVDGKTRVVDTGATGVHARVSADEGHPVYAWLDGVRGDRVDRATVGKVRDVVAGELQQIAELPAGAPELAALADRIRARIAERRRELATFLDTPPGFGFRNVESTWMNLLHDLEAEPTFQRSLTLRPELDAAQAVVGDDKANPWHDRLRAWGLLDPAYAVAMRPSPAARAQQDAARQQRIADELARLTAKYGKDPLPAFQRDYDADTAKIDAATKATPLPPLVHGAPLTLDDDLQYEVRRAGPLDVLQVTVPSMSSAHVTLAFPLDNVADADLFYLAALPALMTDSGVVDGGAHISAADVRERLRREVLSLDARYVSSTRTSRDELVIDGAGGNPDETTRALHWMQLVTRPDWSPANLPRLRDLVDHQLARAHEVMQGEEEHWVFGMRDAWWRQDDPLYLHSQAVLTREWDLYRLRWMLLDAGNTAARERAASKIEALAGQGTSRAAAARLARTLGGVPAELGKDLGDLLGDMPDATVARDWAAACKQIARDLRAGPDAALAGLARTRDAIVRAKRVRIVTTGSADHLARIDDALVAVLTGDGAATRDGAPIDRGHVRAIAARLHDRDAAATDPRYVGLVDPGTASGVFLDTAPATGYLATSDDDLLDYLASNLYTGHGAHTVYSHTVAAGLAYSNGIHPQPQGDRIEYYAERCPQLGQTISFVVALLKDAQPDANLARYALAEAFGARVAERYDQRAAAMAADLADGVTPDKVHAFRSRLLELAKRSDLADELFRRMPKVYAKVVPGLGARIDQAPGAVSFVIGPDKQLAGYQEYLHAAVGKDATLYRLYPRDFWLP